MIKNNSLKMDYLISKLIGKREVFPWGILFFLLIISLLPYVGAAIDRSFFIEGEALGLLEHYGNMCFTIVCPLIFLFAIRGVRYFDRFINNIDTNLKAEKYEKKFKLDEFLQTYWIENPYKFLMYLFILVGFVFATINAINTFTGQEGVWGHDVYDSKNYIGGYVAQRFFFYIWWALVFPILIYQLFVIIIVLNKLFSLVIETDSLDLQPMHPDNAGGLGRLGGMAWNFNIAILLTMAITASLYYTHGYNTPLISGIILQFLLLPVVFFLPLWRVHKAMKIKRKLLLLDISKHYKRVSDILVQKIAKSGKQSAENYDTVKEEYEEESKLRLLYRSLETIPTWPFDTRTIIKFTMTFFLPAVPWLIKLKESNTFFRILKSLINFLY